MHFKIRLMNFKMHFKNGEINAFPIMRVQVTTTCCILPNCLKRKDSCFFISLNLTFKNNFSVALDLFYKINFL